MASTHSPLLGFNTNVRHKGKVFHIQTEDSGVKHPHVITHLFADGGRILKSLKTSYAEHVGAPGMAETVRGLMKEQHKAMFIALRDGHFDSFIESMDGALPEGSRSDAGARAAPGQPTEPASLPPPDAAVAASPAPRSLARPSEPRADAFGKSPTVKVAAGAPSPPTEVDVELLERAASEAQHASPLFRPEASDLPPPPPALLSANRPAGTYRSIGSQPPPTPGTDVGAPGKYVASRPAAIFAAPRPAEAGALFGEDLISDKSLDEVILSFLADEFAGSEDGGKGGGPR